MTANHYPAGVFPRVELGERISLKALTSTIPDIENVDEALQAATYGPYISQTNEQSKIIDQLARVNMLGNKEVLTVLSNAVTQAILKMDPKHLARVTAEVIQPVVNKTIGFTNFISNKYPLIPLQFPALTLTTQIGSIGTALSRRLSLYGIIGDPLDYSQINEKLIGPNGCDLRCLGDQQFQPVLYGFLQEYHDGGAATVDRYANPHMPTIMGGAIGALIRAIPGTKITY